ncbi:MAG: TonB family protein [Verrucomicrobia bacterium]|nr:TonB family protein [Verrucomicrobiota bacterium]
MLRDCPLPLVSAGSHEPAENTVRQPPGVRPGAASGSWHYQPGSTPRTLLAAALVLSAGLHAGILLGFNFKPKPKRVAVEEDLIQLTVTMPNLKDLEEPEPIVSGDDKPPPDPGTLVPMQQDVPTIAAPTDFVQTIDFQSLIPPPDYSQAKVFTIPGNFARGTGRIGEGLVIFNIADLDRPPTPIVQPSPVFPPQLKREVERAVVKVEFIVDTEGKVLNPVVIESTHPGFDEAAALGVSKWKFRAGWKNGRKVNTRMQVPIIFKLISGDEER